MAVYGTLVNSDASGGYTFRNRIINGDMQIAQRGTSFTSNGYTLDRWTIFNSGGTFALSQQTATPGAQPAAGLNNFMRVVRASPSGILYITQKIEDITKFDGAPTVTISFYAKATAAVTLPLRLMQEFGTGGSSSVTVSSVNNSLTTSWQRFTCVYNVPSLNGKTIGTSSYLESTFDMPVTTETIDITGVQLEFGPISTPFEKRHIQQELALCQRYFTAINNGTGNAAYGPYGLCRNALTLCASSPLPVPMRSTPSATFSIGSGTNVLKQDGGTYPVSSMSSAGLSINQIGFEIVIGTSSLTTTGCAGFYGGSFTILASAEL